MRGIENATACYLARLTGRRAQKFQSDATPAKRRLDEELAKEPLVLARMRNRNSDRRALIPRDENAVGSDVCKVCIQPVVVFVLRAPPCKIRNFLRRRRANERLDTYPSLVTIIGPLA